MILQEFRDNHEPALIEERTRHLVVNNSDWLTVLHARAFQFILADRDIDDAAWERRWCELLTSSRDR